MEGEVFPAVRGTGAVPEAPLSAMGETRAQGPGEDEDRSKVTSGTAPVPLTPQRISPPAAYFPRADESRRRKIRAA